MKKLLYLLPLFIIFAFAGCTTTASVTVDTDGGSDTGKSGSGTITAKKSFTFIYYRNFETYFDTKTKVFMVHMPADGSWQKRTERPERLPQGAKGVKITAKSKTPWLNHAHWRKQYPPTKPPKDNKGGMGKRDNKPPKEDGKKPPKDGGDNDLKSAHPFRFFPEHDTYFDVKEKYYMVLMKGGKWEKRAERPKRLPANAEGVLIKAKTKKPWEHHAEWKKKHSAKNYKKPPKRPHRQPGIRILPK